MRKYVWNNAKVTAQGSEKKVTIYAGDLFSARKLWKDLVKEKNFSGKELDDFYYDTWRPSVVDVEPNFVDYANNVTESTIILGDDSDNKTKS